MREILDQLRQGSKKLSFAGVVAEEMAVPKEPFVFTHEDVYWVIRYEDTAPEIGKVFWHKNGHCSVEFDCLGSACDGISLCLLGTVKIFMDAWDCFRNEQTTG